MGVGTRSEIKEHLQSNPNLRFFTSLFLTRKSFHKTMVHQCSDLNDLNAQLEAAGGKLVVIDFFATWCGPCKMIAPKIVEMDAEMNNVVFLKVDVDEAEDAAQEYNIQAMPTFLFIKNKQKVADLCGANVDKLKELIKTHA